MFKIKEIFDVFSKRDKLKKETDINETVRNRIIMLIIGLSDNDASYYSYRNAFSMERFCGEILKVIMMRSGKFDLINRTNGIINGIAEFLLKCKGEIFLDFIEDSFKTNEFKAVRTEKKNEFIDNINYIFSIEDIKFELTKYSKLSHKFLR